MTRVVGVEPWPLLDLAKRTWPGIPHCLNLQSHLPADHVVTSGGTRTGSCRSYPDARQHLAKFVWRLGCLFPHSGRCSSSRVSRTLLPDQGAFPLHQLEMILTDSRMSRCGQRSQSPSHFFFNLRICSAFSFCVPFHTAIPLRPTPLRRNERL